MTWQPPQYLLVTAEQLGQHTPIRVRISGDMHQVAAEMAAAMRDAIRAAREEGRAATLIVPVGPVDQFPLLANHINDERLDCRDVMFINMDEYLTDDDQWVTIDHPLSFRGFMNRKFYDRVDRSLAPRVDNRVFPDPRDPGAIEQLIAARGGVDCCYGGIGINGHIAFNEPPEPSTSGESVRGEAGISGAGISGEGISVEEFADLPTRVLDLARETRTINSVTVGGDVSIIPRRAVTVGMREILAARRLRFYCNRPWQRAIVRRLLHGPLAPSCPSSLLRLHGDAELTLASYVAELPDIQLR